MTALASAWRQLGALEHAQQLVNQALQTADSAELRAAAALENGRILRDRGEIDSAELAFRSAMDAQRVEVRSLARSQLAEMLAERGDKQAAMALLRDADHEAVINDPLLRLRNEVALSTVRFMGGDVAGAEVQLRNALADAESWLPPQHTELARVLNDLAVVRLQQGDAVEAATLFQRATLSTCAGYAPATAR